jgi:hypothetical protein
MSTTARRDRIDAIVLASILSALAGSLTGCGLRASSSHPESSAAGVAVTRGYGREMGHEEVYQGHTIVVTTREDTAGSWSYAVVIRDDGRKLPLVDSGKHRYASEEEARRAASSAAAVAIDRTRITRGKP